MAVYRPGPGRSPHRRPGARPGGRPGAGRPRPGAYRPTARQPAAGGGGTSNGAIGLLIFIGVIVLLNIISFVFDLGYIFY